MPKEYKLTDEQVDALVGFATIIQGVKDATGNYLGKVAVRDWGYKEGILLGFNYDLEKKIVQVEERKDDRNKSPEKEVQIKKSS
jgi:hypothetical protein